MEDTMQSFSILARQKLSNSILCGCSIFCVMALSGCATGNPMSFLGNPAKQSQPMTNEVGIDQASQSQGSPMQTGSGSRDVPRSINPTSRYRNATANSQVPTQAGAQQANYPTQTAEARQPKPNAQLASAITNTPPTMMTLGPRQSLQSVLQSAPGVVLVDFYADWCGPCKRQGKILHELESTAAQHGATIVKVDVDQHTDLKEKFQVTAMPTLLVIKNGKLVHRQKGLTDRARLAAWLSQ